MITCQMQYVMITKADSAEYLLFYSLAQMLCVCTHEPPCALLAHLGLGCNTVNGNHDKPFWSAPNKALLAHKAHAHISVKSLLTCKS